MVRLALTYQGEDMNASQFIDLQVLFLFVFGPILLWVATFTLAGGVITGMYVLWMGFVRWLTYTADEE